MRRLFCYGWRDFLGLYFNLLTKSDLYYTGSC